MKAILLLAGGLVAIVASFLLVLMLSELICKLVAVRWLAIIVRNLQRNRVRTGLTYLASYVLVMVVVLIWSVLHFLNEVHSEKERDFKAVVTSKYVMPSQM